MNPKHTIAAACLVMSVMATSPAESATYHFRQTVPGMKTNDTGLQSQPNTNLPVYSGWVNITKPTSSGIGSTQKIRITGSNLLGITNLSINAGYFPFTEVTIESDSSLIATSPVWPWPYSGAPFYVKKSGVNSDNWIQIGPGWINVGTSFN